MECPVWCVGCRGGEVGSGVWGLVDEVGWEVVWGWYTECEVLCVFGVVVGGEKWCVGWYTKCEVWGAVDGVGEKWCVGCDVRSARCGVRWTEFEVLCVFGVVVGGEKWCVGCDVRSARCGVRWTEFEVLCVFGVVVGVGSGVGGGIRSVRCGVWWTECEIWCVWCGGGGGKWCVGCGVRSVRCGVSRSPVDPQN
ncbi:hypothetical protein J6590_065067 [Homalodisca vitripennis]|nr:hypothetical protein J6590_065067 [Homalodisca vitripennis]